MSRDIQTVVGGQAYNPAAIAATGGNVGVRLLSGGLPVVKPPTGTMGNNGAFTSGTAFDRTIAACFMFFSANQIAAGVAAGLYYATGSSTTVLTVFNNTYTTGIPVAPASPTPFVTTGPGATTGATTSVTAQQVSVPGNSMGASGVLLVNSLVSATNSATAKAVTVTFGGNTMYTASVGASRAAGATIAIANQGTGAQVGAETGGAFVGDTAPVHTGNADTTAAQTLAWALITSGAATDWIISEIASVYYQQ